MTEVNVSTTVGMFATVGGNVCNNGGKYPRQWGNVRNSGGNVCNSGEIEYDLGNLTVEMVIYNCA